jgi:6-phosphogluconolactonase (cycloisomerase 2 family)
MSALAGAAFAPRPLLAQGGKLALYASVGGELTHYDVDVDGVTLTKREAVKLPVNVQYAWPHASRRFLYVASSNGSGQARGDTHHAAAFRIDPASGALQRHGDPIVLRSRPINITTDVPSAHALIAYNDPSGVTVHRINADGTLGDEVTQPGRLDGGIYAHQIRVSPSNDLAILVTRGNDADGAKPEDPGALKVFNYTNGVLSNEVSIAPGNGYGFGPRHLDFHPARRWMYVSLERQNQMYVFRLNGQKIDPAPIFKKDTLGRPSVENRKVLPPVLQQAGTVHVHPSGRYVYGVNRANSVADEVIYDGFRMFAGGENTIVVYAVKADTGDLTAVQHMDTRGMHARTFAIDPSGQLLVAAHIQALAVRDGDAVKVTPACLSLFRIGNDGTLTFVRKYDVEVGKELMFWMGMVKLP